MNYKEWWTKSGLGHITAGSTDCPEGWDVKAQLKELWAKWRWGNKKVLDFGCGPGRLSGAFSPSNYVGVDLNPKALALAKKRNPKFTYKEIDVKTELPQADILFAYTVFNHIDDDLTKEYGQRFYAMGIQYLVICELLGREWRSSEVEHPSWGKELSEYCDAFSGYGLKQEKRRLYKHYDKDTRRNKHISFLIFERREA